MLQENNAIAVFDMKTEEIKEIRGLGFKKWIDLTLDVSDKDGGKKTPYRGLRAKKV